MSDSSNQSDDQYEAEATDSDEIDLQDFPPDRPLGIDDLLGSDVSAAGDYAPDNLRQRDRRLRPDVARSDDPRISEVAPGGLIDPDDPYGDDGTAQLVGERTDGDWDVIDPGAVLSDSVAADHRSSDSWPAEEAALHLIDESVADGDDLQPLPHLRGTAAGRAGDHDRGRSR
jgi:hypothetical protein